MYLYIGALVSQGSGGRHEAYPYLSRMPWQDAIEMINYVT
jgi:hypothetical protein